MRKKYILLFIAVLSVSLIIFFINYENKIDVKTIKVVKGNIKEYISEDAKTIFDNEYEISCYACGTTELLIPWKDIKTLVIKDGPLGKLAN